MSVRLCSFVALLIMNLSEILNCKRWIKSKKINKEHFLCLQSGCSLSCVVWEFLCSVAAADIFLWIYVCDPLPSTALPLSPLSLSFSLCLLSSLTGDWRSELRRKGERYTERGEVKRVRDGERRKWEFPGWDALTDNRVVLQIWGSSFLPFGFHFLSIQTHWKF